MLKVTILLSPAVQRFVLEGRLAEPWLSEVKTSSEDARLKRQSRRCVVDLRGVISIDRAGEEALLGMRREGAQFVACGISTRHRLKKLGIECRQGVALAGLVTHGSSEGEL